MEIVVLVMSALCYSANAAVAPYITPCASSDSSCLQSSAQKAVPTFAAGLPDLGISSMDPMEIGRVKATEAGLNMDFKNNVVKGLKNCQIAVLKKQGRKMYLELKCPHVTLNGDYVLGGRLLIMPIEGNGKYKIKIRDIIVKINFDVDDKQVDGKKFWDITGWKHTTDVQTNVEYQFQNLFNGNKALSNAIHQFANSNWREIYGEVAPPIVKQIVSKIVEETKKFFNKVPASEFSLDS